MGYRLEAGERPPAGIKRIALEQIDKALWQLEESQDRDEAVHDARKRFKKVRALLRLVRDEIGEDVYKRENICFRDAGRRLSQVRDSFVLVETLDSLTARYADQLAGDAFAGLRQELVAQHEQVVRRLLDDEERMAEVAATVRAARERVLGWPIESKEFDAFSGGLQRVYKRGRRRLQDAYAEPVSANFHEWRKRVKYLWYHMRILRPVWPKLQKSLSDAVHELADYLGDEHDLAELRAYLQADPEADGESNEHKLLLALIEQRRQELQSAAWPLGERIYVEKASSFVSRIEAYWQIHACEGGPDRI